MELSAFRSVISAFFISLIVLNTALKGETKKITEGDYTYEITDNDPLNARIYTLKNGLKVYMTVYKDEPRVTTYIAVRTGSKNDPSDCTGLAHYLEHMVFKGTDQIASLDWEKEKPLLTKISNLYEDLRSTKDSTKRVWIYSQIDSVSNVASNYCAPSEYDKMITSIGAKYTNAYTSYEQTVYVNDIPATELEKWLMVESERFSQLVLRLFHTELEAVYEEFNRGQDNDYFKQFHSLFDGLFKKHTYGTQTTIGEGEHLKNPSMIKIHEFFNTYYVPNNMALCLSGDLDPAKTIALVDKYFGSAKSKQIPEFSFEKEGPITEPIIQEVYGSQEERIALGFRFDGIRSNDALMVELIDNLLSNGQAGLIDLNLNQKQKVLDASSNAEILTDYSVHYFFGFPRKEQKLEEVKDLILGEIEKIKNGDFEDWLIDAAINNMMLRKIKQYEHNYARAHSFVDAFIYGIDWEDYIKRNDAIAKITKQEVMDFAKKHYTNNYVVVNKRLGKNPDQFKVAKPPITPIKLNRDENSEFFTKFNETPSSKLEPVFLDYKQDIHESKLKEDVPFYQLTNKNNETFNMMYILDMGRNHNKKLSLAIEYLPYLATNKYSAEQLKQEFFKLGLKFNVFTSVDRVYVSLSGLESSFEEGVKLFEHILENIEPDKQSLDNLILDIIKTRADNKLSKRRILWGGMFNYGKYGKISPFTNRLSENELKLVNPKELTEIIKGITDYKHRVFYYGTQSHETVKNLLNEHHNIPKEFKDYPKPIEYTEQPTDKKKVYFVHYDMVQGEIIMLSKNEKYHKEWEPLISLYRTYYGSGLSSIVFQELRESKALAYSAFAGFSIPNRDYESHYSYEYIGTQIDKLPDAVKAFDALLESMPAVERQFNASVNSIKTRIETGRITKMSIFWDYERAKRKGIDYDIRKDIYKTMTNVQMDDLIDFHKKHLKGKPHIYLVLADRNRVDMDYLKTLGDVEELTLEQVFGY